MRPEPGDVGLDVRNAGVDLLEAVHDERGLRVARGHRDVRDGLRGQQALRAAVTRAHSRFFALRAEAIGATSLMVLASAWSFSRSARSSASERESLTSKPA